MKSKDESFDVFKLWFLCAKETSGEKLGCLQTDDKKEFISIILKNFCKKRSIIIGYVTLYIYEENEIGEQY